MDALATASIVIRDRVRDDVVAGIEEHARRLEFVRLLALNREFHDVINDVAANREATEELDNRRRRATPRARA